MVNLGEITVVQASIGAEYTILDDEHTCSPGPSHPAICCISSAPCVTEMHSTVDLATEVVGMIMPPAEDGDVSP